MTTEPPVIDDLEIDVAEFRRVQEYYESRGWTDGLPVVPVTASYLSEFLACTARDPDEVLISMPHLNKNLTVRLAALNAALAGLPHRSTSPWCWPRGTRSGSTAW